MFNFKDDKELDHMIKLLKSWEDFQNENVYKLIEINKMKS